ncbi:hypothetical protein LMIY3S_01523 [Labrys miyagiensis]
MTQRQTACHPPAHLLTHDIELDRLMCPHRFYKRPANVLSDAALTLAEQRAILSSWASQTCASGALPTPGVHGGTANRLPVSFEEITDALAQLDRAAPLACASRLKRAIN